MNMQEKFDIRIFKEGSDMGDGLYVILSYDSSKPYEVKMRFPGDEDNSDLDWYIGLELMSDGLKEESGLGDVVITPMGTRCYITLKGRGEQAALALNRAKLKKFVDTAMVSLYNQPSASPKLDQEIEELLRKGK